MDERFAKELKNSKLFETEDFFQKNSEQCIKAFQKHFISICDKIVNLQKKWKIWGSLLFRIYAAIN